MEGTRVRWLMISIVVVVVTAMATYLVVVASPETLEPGVRSAAHDDIDCMRCHSSYEGVDDDLCLECHPELPTLEWHSGAGGDEDCVECHYEHAGNDYITDLTKVPAHPERDLQLSGVHSPLRCNECHWTASMEAECAFCHERFIKGTHEVGFTDDCELCHIQSIWDVDYDHAHEKAECLDCHGETPDHTYPGYLEYTAECNVCHEVDLWLVPEFDHDGVNASCQQCHPMSLDPLYGGKSADCDDCHLNTSWWPQKVDHFVLEPPCTRCHGDVRPTEHLTDREMAPMDCDSCHLAGTSWNRQIQHITHPQPCIQCHGEASEVHEGPYADDCTWCHITDRRDVLKPHPNQTVECTLCHLPEHLGGDPERSVDAANAERCDICHVAGTRWVTNDIDHDALDLDCSACHDAPHDPIGGWEAACNVCHLTEYWQPIQVDHDRFSDDCLACHKTTHPNGKDQYSEDCTLCHVVDDWATIFWDHDPSRITGIDCVNCHDDIHRGTLGIVCEDCHTTDTWETEVINP